MIKNIYLTIFILITLSFILSNCVVDSNTGSITIMNKTDIIAKDILIGKNWVPFVSSKSVYTIFFRFSDENAKILIDDFNPPDGFKGKIDLELNYTYILSLVENDGKYIFTITAEKANMDRTPIME